MWDTEVKSIPLEIQGHTLMLDFHVMHMNQANVVLNRALLHGLGNMLNRSYISNTIAFEDNGVRVLLMGEKDIPSSPLVNSTEIDVLASKDEIKQAFFFYSLSLLHNGEACYELDNTCDVSSFLSLKEPSSALHFVKENSKLLQSNVDTIMQLLLKEY